MRSSYSSKNRNENAEALVADLFDANGWDVNRSPGAGNKRPELIVKKGAQGYVVEIKALAEGRADRVIPLLSQAILQAQANALVADNAQPLAVIYVENASQSLAKQVGSFVEQYAPNVAAGLVSKNGLRYFKGAGLEALNGEPGEARWNGSAPSNQPVNESAAGPGNPRSLASSTKTKISERCRAGRGRSSLPDECLPVFATATQRRIFG